MIKKMPGEICRGPIVVEGFDENHTLADIARWLMKNPIDAEEVHRMLGEMLNDES